MRSALGNVHYHGKSPLDLDEDNPMAPRSHSSPAPRFEAAYEVCFGYLPTFPYGAWFIVRSQVILTMALVSDLYLRNGIFAWYQNHLDYICQPGPTAAIYQPLPPWYLD
jgi:hypothetical protein